MSIRRDLLLRSALLRRPEPVVPHPAMPAPPHPAMPAPPRAEPAPQRRPCGKRRPPAATPAKG